MTLRYTGRDSIGLPLSKMSKTTHFYMGVEPKIGGKTTKMDGENNGKAYFSMDDLGVPLFLETPI